jgi:hypothetical protein
LRGMLDEKCMISLTLLVTKSLHSPEKPLKPCSWRLFQAIQSLL